MVMTIRVRTTLGACIRRAPAVFCFMLLATGSALAGDEVAPSYGILSILPSIIAIVLAIVSRQVLIALFVGIWFGASIVVGYDPASGAVDLLGPAAGFLRVLDTYFIGALADPDHAAIVLFTLCLGGMVRIMAPAGGLPALVRAIARWATTVSRGQVSTWFMGILIFFDDYANTLLVGNTMRPFTDKLTISREKLAYIVDSTAAPVASIAMISTWIGFELERLREGLALAGINALPYDVFLDSIPYRFYGVLAIFFVLAVAITNRDFLAMRTAEERARSSGKVLADNAEPLVDHEVTDVTRTTASRPHWCDAVVPILTVIVVMVVGLYCSGVSALTASGAATAGRSLREIIGEADSYHALMWASFSGALVAVVLALRNLSLNTTMRAYLSGLKAMVPAMAILVLAWAIGAVCTDLKTADFCVSVASEALPPFLVPIIVFIIAAFISFATGSSWATMAILVPLVVPLAWNVTQEAAVAEGTAEAILLGSIGAVLSGATFGDHCSPISDTTIMSSMASACDHIHHVRTQMPYAIVVAMVAMGLGYLPAGIGLDPWVGLAAGAALLLGVLFIFGRTARPGATAGAPPPG